MVFETSSILSSSGSTTSESPSDRTVYVWDSSRIGELVILVSGGISSYTVVDDN
ncbi:hypothetical protein DPMN_126674 [Dreissena polymorpha]|uniref:Uncharacterized protein n=1 Tax=Dreissena polymorpha TaxID=45954 RepID=A0A9D4GW64_DREPO|nr:hypothetical protein DPMN_126674 [Dreissena polymorpha]